MKYPEYKYINVALGGVFNRKGIYDVNKLGDPSGKEETYGTYFRYNEEMTEHFKEVDSVKGYRGTAYSEWLPIDIDSEDLEEAQDYLKRLLQNFENYGIDENVCRFYFSGAKGFHVMIPSGYFKAEPSDDIGKRFRNVAVELSEGIKIDTAIYDKTRLLRLPNTKHGKSGLLKIELYPFEAKGMSIKDIQHKALVPVEALEVDDDYYISEELTELYHGELEKPKNKKAKSGAKAKICLETMMHETDLQGERDNIGIRVSSHLRQSGLSLKMMWVSLIEWNDSLDAPLEDYEIERIYEQGLEDYSFGCKDEFLKGRCDPECIFFQDDWADAQERIDNHARRTKETSQ